MFGCTAPKLCSSPNTSPAQVFLLHRSQFKSLRAGLRPTHAAPPCLLCLSPKNSTNHHATHPILPRYAHVRCDFAAVFPSAARFHRPNFHQRHLSSPPDFSSPTPKFPGGFITTDARFPPPDLKNCDRSQTKSQKLRVRAANKQKKLLLPSMPISPLKTYRNRKIGGNTPQTQQAVAHHKRRNLPKNRLF